MSIIVSSISREPVKVQHTYQGKPCSIDIRPIDSEIRDEIRDKVRTFEFVNNPKTGKMERVEILDETAYDMALFDYIIAGWSGFSGPDKKDLPCTRENKIKVAALHPGKEDKEALYSWILKNSRELGKQLHAALEAEIKN